MRKRLPIILLAIAGCAQTRPTHWVYVTEPWAAGTWREIATIAVDGGYLWWDGSRWVMHEYGFLVYEGNE